MEAFRKDLIALINTHNIEGDSGTPDFILADHLMGCLEVFNRTTQKRGRWYMSGMNEKGNDGTEIPRS